MESGTLMSRNYVVNTECFTGALNNINFQPPDCNPKLYIPSDPFIVVKNDAVLVLKN